jgi:hypothetical protein
MLLRILTTLAILIDISSCYSKSSIDLKCSALVWSSLSMAPESSFLRTFGFYSFSWFLKTVLNLISSFVHLYQESDITKMRCKHSVKRSLLSELNSRNYLKVCLVFASCLMLETHSSMISIFSLLMFGSLISNRSSYITFRGPSLLMKCEALTELPLSRLAMEKRQLSLSLISSAVEFPVLFTDPSPVIYTSFCYCLSSLSIKGVRALSTGRLSGELTKL